MGVILTYLLKEFLNNFCFLNIEHPHLTGRTEVNPSEAGQVIFRSIRSFGNILKLSFVPVFIIHFFRT